MERETLAPYAQMSGDTRGRRHREEEHPLRTVYQRDRDRIIHCRAFRRLEYKTQVFVNHEGDHYRTRLTHTMEVAAIGRTIARILQLNEDLTEAICLAHDVGHPPFGHSGEQVLNDLMKDHGGFEHNLQSLRVVDVIERKYPDFPGLNLSWEVREGIMKHSTEYDKTEADDPGLDDNASLEAQIVCIADEIAYNTHDIDDGLEANILTHSQMGEVDLWKEANAEFEARYPNVDEEIRIYFGVRNLINHLVNDLTANTMKLVRESGVGSANDVRKNPAVLVRFSDEIAEKEESLKRFLNENVYQNPYVRQRNEMAREIIESLFRSFLEKPEMMSETYRKRIKGEPLHLVVCDYIAGMTDRYPFKRYRKLLPNRVLSFYPELLSTL